MIRYVPLINTPQDVLNSRTPIMQLFFQANRMLVERLLEDTPDKDRKERLLTIGQCAMHAASAIIVGGMYDKNPAGDREFIDGLDKVIADYLNNYKPLSN